MSEHDLTIRDRLEDILESIGLIGGMESGNDRIARLYDLTW